MKKRDTTLLIGPKPFKATDKVGGVIVLFDSLIRVFKSNNISYKDFDTNFSNYNGYFSFILQFNFFLIAHGRSAKSVVLNATAKDVIFLSPFLLFYRMVFGYDLVLRKFAGNFDDFYESLNPLFKCYCRFVLKKYDCLFFETLSLVDYFLAFNSDVAWFPNVRPEIDCRNTNLRGKKIKLIFISQIMESKGVDVLLDAMKILGDKATLTIAGPLVDESYLGRFDAYDNVDFIGSVDQSEVTLLNLTHDIFVFPSYFKSEGYPGVLIEALIAGIPIVSTHWRAIPELMEGSGKLVEIKNTQQLVEAIYEVADKIADYQEKSFIRGCDFYENSTTLRVLDKFIIRS